jgi:hypothetical protein
VRIDADTSLPDVARAVCTALDRVGVTAVLTGGSAATYYAPAAYQSVDIDFVAVVFETEDPEDVEREFASLGYRLERDHYRHESSPFPLEFPAGPLAVGGDLVREWSTERTADGVLHVLRPTDCCKDRLAAFFHWNDRSGLAQALAVYTATGKHVHLEEIEAWAEREGAVHQYAEFVRRLDNGR